MKTEKQVRTWWMDTDILEKALDHCDLGDGYSARVRMYPHRTMLPELTQVIAHEDHLAIVAELEGRISKLRKALEDAKDEHMWGGSEDSGGTLHAGTGVVKIINEALKDDEAMG